MPPASGAAWIRYRSGRSEAAMKAEFTDLVAAPVAQGITKFVLVPLSRPASWPDELAWLAPLVKNVKETA